MIEESPTVGCYLLFMGFIKSPFQVFESYLRILTDLDEEDIQLILIQFNSKFITYKVSPGIYTSKDISELLSRGFKTEFENGEPIQPNKRYDETDSIIIECDSNTLRSILVARHEIIDWGLIKNHFLILF